MITVELITANDILSIKKPNCQNSKNLLITSLLVIQPHVSEKNLTLNWNYRPTKRALACFDYDIIALSNYDRNYIIISTVRH